LYNIWRGDYVYPGVDPTKLFILRFFFFGVKIGHFTINNFFQYVSKMQAYQRKMEKFFVSEEKKFGRIHSTGSAVKENFFSVWCSNLIWRSFGLVKWWSPASCLPLWSFSANFSFRLNGVGFYDFFTVFFVISKREMIIFFLFEENRFDL